MRDFLEKYSEVGGQMNENGCSYRVYSIDGRDFERERSAQMAVSDGPIEANLLDRKFAVVFLWESPPNLPQALQHRQKRQIERLKLYVKLNECVPIHFNKLIYPRLSTVHSNHSKSLQRTQRKKYFSKNSEGDGLI